MTGFTFMLLLQTALIFLVVGTAMGYYCGYHDAEDEFIKYTTEKDQCPFNK